MTRRTFFRRTVGALATAAIAPRLQVPIVIDSVRLPVPYGATTEHYMITVRVRQAWDAFDWRAVNRLTE